MAEAQQEARKSRVGRRPPPPPRESPLSASVAQVARKHRKPLTAFQLACALLDTHAYAGRASGTVKPGEAPHGTLARPVADWLTEIRTLFHLEPEKTLDGRIVVFGASVLEPELFRRLWKDRFLPDLEQELRGRGTRLSPEGERRLAELRLPAEIVPTLRDDPALLDQLGRKILAEVLCMRIQRVRREGPEWVPRRTMWQARLRSALPGRRSDGDAADGWRGPGKRCFLVHIDAPWGAGKTSLLRFLGDELRGNGWAVIDFNAWEHQRIVPPWWWLMTKLHDDGIGEAAASSRTRPIALWLHRLWWRVRDQWALFVALPVAALAAYLLYRAEFFGEDISSAGEKAKSAGAILAFLVATIGATTALNRWLLGGSDGAAASLLRRTRDPMRLVKRRFGTVVHTMRQPVAIFVDDLDRCTSKFVVELLEGVQTLFAEQPVVYVVAADGNWIREAYAKEYADFCRAAAEPGRPLGWLFLEKTFQERVRLPRISRNKREAFWAGLLGSQHSQSGNAAADDAAATKLFRGQSTPVGIGRTLKDAEDSGKYDLEALQRAAAKQLETEAVEQHTQHTLNTFGHLLEDNPRAMKKLINAYGIQRHLLVLEDPDVIADETQLRQLALWTLVNLRWPLVGEYLERHPEAVDDLVADRALTVDADDDGLARAFRDRAIGRVVRGEGVLPRVSLNSAAVRRLVGLPEEPAAESSEPA